MACLFIVMVVVSWVHKRCSTLHKASSWSTDWRCSSCAVVALPSLPAPPASPGPPSPCSPSASPLNARPPVSPPARTLPNPPPQLPQGNSPFLQFNANGIQHCHAELSTYLNSHKVLIAAIQETKLKPTSSLKAFPGYTALRRDRPNVDGGGGLLFLIHHSISYTPFLTDPFFSK